MLQGLLYHQHSCPRFLTYAFLFLVLETLVRAVLLRVFHPEVRADAEFSP